MKVTLRKAHAIQKAIKSAVGNISVGTRTEVSIYAEDPAAVVTAAREEVSANLAILTKLNLINFELRREVSKANSSHGINDLMLEDAELQNTIQRLSRLTKGTAAVSEAQLVSLISATKARNEKSDYHQAESVTAELFAASDIAAFKDQVLTASRRRTEIQDELLGLNTNVTVNISDENYSYLREQGVI